MVVSRVVMRWGVAVERCGVISRTRTRIGAGGSLSERLSPALLLRAHALICDSKKNVLAIQSLLLYSVFKQKKTSDFSEAFR